MRILYLSDEYSRNVMGVKTSMFRELVRRGVKAEWGRVHMKGTGIVDGARVVQQIARHPVDWVWVVHSWSKIEGAGLKQFEAAGAFLLGFGLSDPRNYDVRRLRQYHVYATNDYGVFRSLQPSDLVCWSPPSCDASFHVNVNLQRDIDVLFYGLGNHPVLGDYRPSFVRKLKRALPHLNIVIAGNNWPSDIGSIGHVDGQNLLMLINRAKIGIDITAEAAPLGRRNFEMPACGTMTIRRRTLDTTKLFPGCPMYDDLDELAKTIEFYLENASYRQVVANRQYATVRAQHSVERRIDCLMEFCFQYRRTRIEHAS